MAKKKPWWKRAWPYIAAILGGFLTAVALVVSKSQLAGRRVKAVQDKDNKHLDEKLAAANAVKNAKLDAVEARADLAVEKASNAHEERLRVEERKVDDRADELARDPAGLPAGLVDSLSRAERKR